MRTHLTALFSLALLPTISMADGVSRLDSQDWDLMDEDELWGEEIVPAAKVSAATVVNVPFLDMRIYEVLAISSTTYTPQLNMYDIVSTTNAGTTTETHKGTFYAWLPGGNAPALKTFTLLNPVTANNCTTWRYEFAATGGANNTCTVKICFGGKTQDFTSCTTGYVARASAY